MYLLTEIVLLSPLILYACFRIRRLFARKLLKNASTAFFLLIVAGYPIAETLSHNSGDAWAQYPMIAGYLSLPYLLYIVLTVIASDLPLILLDHRPIDLDAASNSNVDIQFSGHTHDGQLFPVNLLYPMRYQLTWGYMQKRRTHFIVTSGVQVWGPPVRTAGDSEIVAVDLILRD